MREPAKIGYQYKPRPRKQGHDVRFNDRVLTVLAFGFGKGGEAVQVRSENAQTGTSRVQWMRLKRLVSSEYKLIVAIGSLAPKPEDAVKDFAKLSDNALAADEPTPSLAGEAAK